MIDIDLGLLRVVALLVAVGVFIVAAIVESALGHLNRARVQSIAASGHPRAADLDRLIDRLSSAHIAAQALRTIGGGGVLALIVTTSGIRESDIALTSAIAVTLIALVIGQSFCDIIALANPERAILILLPLFGPAMRVTGPSLRALHTLGGAIAGVLGAARPHGHLLTAEDLMTQTEAALEAGLIEEAEQEMIQSIIETRDTSVREVMVPRLDMTALPATTTIGNALDVIAEAGYSRVPIFDDSLDQIVGILYAKDLLRFRSRDALRRLVREIAREPHFVPESKKTDDLLRELRGKRVHIAIVVDEYGGTAGLVTIEDLLEEIVGEIQDEYDDEEAKIKMLSEDEAIVDATVAIDDVNEELHLALHSEDVDTIGGLIYERLKKMPRQGDAVEVEGAEMTVEATSGRRVRKVRIRRRKPTDANGDETRVALEPR